MLLTYEKYSIMLQYGYRIQDKKIFYYVCITFNLNTKNVSNFYFILVFLIKLCSYILSISGFATKKNCKSFFSSFTRLNVYEFRYSRKEILTSLAVFIEYEILFQNRSPMVV